MMKKTRLELECNCPLCKIRFNIWNLEEIVGKGIGDGVQISNWKCFNCDVGLEFDIVRGRVPEGYEPER